MDVIPAIDLMKSQVVRLRKGNAKDVIPVGARYNPSEIVQKWLDDGATSLHIIDLDRALGSGTNEFVVKDLIKSASVPIQVGGGLRSKQSIETLLENPRVRVILGTIAFREPALVGELIQEYGSERIIIALDYREDIVQVNGWVNSTGKRVLESLHQFKEIGVARFLVTSTQNDGMLCGPDIDTLKNLTCINGCSMSAAGGIRNLRDIRTLRNIGLDSIIIGRSIYEGLNLQDAIRAARRDD